MEASKESLAHSDTYSSTIDEHGVDHILVVDFGSQYTRLILKKLKSINIRYNLVSCESNLLELECSDYKGAILSGGPNSVYENSSLRISQEIWDRNIPVLGICYGLQEMVHSFKGIVASSINREYGNSKLVLEERNAKYALGLFDGVPTESRVWMSCGDMVKGIPDCFVKLGHTNNAQYAAIAHREKPFLGLQFHPETPYTVFGDAMLRNFVLKICKCKQIPYKTTYEEAAKILGRIPDHEHVLGAVGGGTGSAVISRLAQKLLGERYHAVFINTGLFEAGCVERVRHLYESGFCIPLTVVNAEDRFLESLKGLKRPEDKRNVVGQLFVDIISEKRKDLGNPKFLMLGTICSDMIESNCNQPGPTVMIKTYPHTILARKVTGMKIIEPLGRFFQDEVVQLAKHLTMPNLASNLRPFSGSGYAVRILGEVSRDSVSMLRDSDRIITDVLVEHDIYKRISQVFGVLLPIKTVGVMGDKRTYERALCIRAVDSKDFMAATFSEIPHHVLMEISTRIVNRVPGVNRVLYDITSKPPGSIEFE